jgi:hypothetical protein
MPRIIDAFTQFLDGSGSPIANGYLKFLVSNTNNDDKDTFADDNLSIKNSNPVQLDAEGRCPSVFGSGRYRVNLLEKDPATGLPGALISQFDPVEPATEVANTTGQFSGWSSTVTYAAGDIVIHNGNYYRSIQAANINNSPSASPSFWEKMPFVRVWNTNVTYDIDAVVMHNNNLYFSLAGSNTGNNPTSSPTWWGTVSGGTVFTQWQESGTILRPITTGTHDIGDSTHYVRDLYINSDIISNTSLEIFVYGLRRVYITNSSMYFYGTSGIYVPSGRIIAAGSTPSSFSHAVTVGNATAAGHALNQTIADTLYAPITQTPAILNLYNQSGAPGMPVTNDFWYDGNGYLKLWNGSSWDTVLINAVQMTSPTFNANRIATTVGGGSRNIKADVATTITSGGSINVPSGQGFLVGGSAHTHEYDTIPDFIIPLHVVNNDTACAAGDAKAGFVVTSNMSFMELVAVRCGVYDAGVTGSMTIMVKRRRNGFDYNMLSSALTLSAGWTAVTYSIATSNDDILVGDYIYAEILTVHSGTPANGLELSLTFNMP